ncbi:MAG: hypothetical protein QXS18_06425 [Thermoplasmata archaeon]
MKNELKIPTFLEILLVTLPFLLFLVYWIFSQDIKMGYVFIELWTSINRKLAYIMLILTLLLIIIKAYKHNWIFIWLGLLLYFSSIFILPDILRFLGIKIYAEDIVEWVVNHFLSFQGWGIPSPQYPPLLSFPTLIFILIHGVVFFLLFFKINVPINKLLFLILAYFYSYCNLIVLHYYNVPFYYVEICIFSVIRTSIVFNSFVFMVFVVFFLRVKANLNRIILLILFVLFNFIAFHISLIKEFVLSSLYKREPIGNYILGLVEEYMKLIVLKSGFIILLIILGGLYLLKKYCKKAI